MKRLLATVVLLLGFLFTTGFTSDPVNSEYVSGRDSTTVEVKFQNPRVIISDERTGEAIANFMQERDSLFEAFVTDFGGTSDELIALLETDQERRYESAMDYLSRRLNMSPDNIIEIISDNISRQNRLFLVFAIMLTLTIGWMILRDTRSVRSSSDRLVDVLYTVMFAVVLYLLYCSILRIVAPDEFEFIKNLTQLSG
jgi:hypothetical protein